VNTLRVYFHILSLWNARNMYALVVSFC